MIGSSIFNQDGMWFDRSEILQFSSATVKAVTWVEDAKIDGWRWEAHDQCHTFTLLHGYLEREGYKIRLLIRTYEPHPTSTTGDGYSRATVSMCGWGPDGVSIDPLPDAYSWDAIVNLTTTCQQCGATGVETRRVGFANRMCWNCASVLRPIIEKRGWTE